MLPRRLDLYNIVKQIFKNHVPKKNLCTSSKNYFKVAVIGGAGGIGQPLSLLLKLNPLVTELSVFDVAKLTPGVAIDLSHINTKCRVKGYQGEEALCAALKCAHVVVVPAGVPRKPGMSRDDLFNTNASIVYNTSLNVAKECPDAILAIITNPVNSAVPIAAETLKKAGVYDPRKVLGVCTLDVVRSAAFIGEINCCDPACVEIPVIGGHAGATIIPVLSQSQPQVNLQDQEQIEKLTKRIQEAGTEVVKAKAGGGSATLSMAFAAAQIVSSILKGLNGEMGIIECAYVHSNVTKAAFFSNPLVLGMNGVEQNLGYGCINEYENKLLEAAIPTLIKNIDQGIDFVQKQAGGKQGDKCK